MTSSSKFIDYFVHDIVDYTQLTNENGEFKPNPEMFDIKESIDHIETILNDKAQMKNIKVRSVFENFEESNSVLSHPYLVKTDKKRFQ